jgi:ATP synthase F1 epsilon subunit
MVLQVSIILPDRIFWKDSAKEVILPTLSGQMGVLKDHIPLLTGLDTGLLLIRSNSSENWINIVVTGGFALINRNKLTILVNEAELGSNIDITEAEQTFLNSKLTLESDNVSQNKKKIESLSQFKKARARYQASQQLKN